MPARPGLPISRRAMLRRTATAFAAAPVLAALGRPPGDDPARDALPPAGNGEQAPYRAAPCGPPALDAQWATLTVAASDASPRSRATADFVCTGFHDEAQIARAIDALPPAGGRVVLSEGTFTFRRGVALAATRPLKIEGQGAATVVRYSSGADAFSFAGSASEAHTVIELAEVDTAFESRVTRLTVEDASAFTVNDICKIYSEDERPYRETGSKNYAGELFEVRAVDAQRGHVYAHGLLRLRYAANPRVRILDHQPVELRSLRFEAAGGARGAEIAPGNAAVSFRTLVRPRIQDCHIRSAWRSGVKLANCWMADVDVTTDDLVNEPARNGYGYGVETYGANYANSVRVRGEGARHLFTTTQPKDDRFHANRWDLYGEPIATVVHDSVSVNARGTPFDTHEAGIDTTFVNCHVWSPRTPPEGGIVPTGFQDRAQGTRFLGCTVTGANAGWKFLGQAQDTEFHGELDGCAAYDLSATADGRRSAGLICEATTPQGELVVRNFKVQGADTGIWVRPTFGSRISVIGALGSGLADAFMDIAHGARARVVNAHIDRATPFKMRGDSALEVANVYVSRAGESTPANLVYVASDGAKTIRYSNIAADVPGMGIASRPSGVRLEDVGMREAGGVATLPSPLADVFEPPPAERTAARLYAGTSRVDRPRP